MFDRTRYDTPAQGTEHSKGSRIERGHLSSLSHSSPYIHRSLSVMSFRAISKHLHFRSQRANRPEQPILAAEFDSRSRESSTTLPGSSRGYVSSHGSSKYDTASGSAYPIDKKTEVSTTDNSKSYYDAPPAYINKDSRAQSINIGPASSIAIMDPGSAPYEDPLFILTKFDTWFLVDDSGSMTYQGRWKQAC